MNDRPCLQNRLAGWLRSTSRYLTAMEVVLFAIVAVWATWPLGNHLLTALPTGTERVATVPLFNAWTVWWNAESAANAYRGFWDAPIFYPADDSFAFSETQLPTVLVAPLVWFGESPVAAYNVYLLGSLMANGWAARCLLKRVNLSAVAALFGGLMVEMLPFVHWQLGVLQLVPLWGILWTLHGLLIFSERPGVFRSLNIGAAFSVTYLLCHHYGLFLTVLLLTGGWYLPGRSLCDVRFWTRLLPGALLATSLLAPLVIKQTAVMQKHDWERDPALVETLSVEPRDYAVAPWPQLVPTDALSPWERRIHWKLSPGTIVVILAVVGLTAGLIHSGHRNWYAFCLTVIGVAIVLSFGPKFCVGPICPYELLASYVPGFAQVRNVFRFAMFAQLVVALCAANGVDVIRNGFGLCRISRKLSTAAESAKPHSCWKSRILAGLAIALGLAATFEIRPATQDLFHVPLRRENQKWIDWLVTNSEKDAVIACLPIPSGTTVFDYEQTAEWMYLGTFHRRRMLNGYSGFFPESYRQWKDAMQTFPDPASLNALNRNGVSYCIVRNDAFRGQVVPQLKPVFHDNTAGVTVYELHPR